VRTTAVLVLATCAALTAQYEAPVLMSREVYLMGTRATLSVHALRREAGLAALESALTALEDTEAELSTWRDASAISAFNQQPIGQPWMASARLCSMFADVWTWHRETGGAFDPAIGRVLAAWDVHGEGAVPTAAAHARALASAGLALLTFDRTACTLTRRSAVTLDVGAFGKGEALDRAAAAIGGVPWMIDLGGQISVGGNAPPGDGWTIAIADPRQRTVPALHLRMTTGSLSTSAGTERDLSVSGRRVGHILDPRTGDPATFDGSVTVWHERGLVADILSTALYVMGPEVGRRWAEARGIAVCYLIPDGTTLRVESTAAFGKLTIAPG
jgi:thiamine biosynthesis lipoprotein